MPRAAKYERWNVQIEWVDLDGDQPKELSWEQVVSTENVVLALSLAVALIGIERNKLLNMKDITNVRMSYVGESQ